MPAQVQHELLQYFLLEQSAQQGLQHGNYSLAELQMHVALYYHRELLHGDALYLLECFHDAKYIIKMIKNRIP